MKYVLKASYGNDSIALIRWAHEEHLDGVVCLFNETGWAAKGWIENRVIPGEALAHSYGFATDRTESMGMEALVKWKRGWPFGGARFCTEHLKILPTLKWLDEHDPDKQLVGVCGVRREESEARKDWQEWIRFSEKDGGRDLWSPLVEHSDAERDELILKTGMPVLDHRSRECSPCIHANKSDLRQLGEPEIARLERIESELGNTKNGHPRVMFRPKRHGGEAGIRQAIAWANNDDGKQMSLFVLGQGSGCDAGACAER